MTQNEHFVIIGASHAGVQLAVSLRESGYLGRVSLISNEAHHPYHRPPLSKAFLKDASLGVQVLRAQSYFVDHDIDLRLSLNVEEIDPAGSSVKLSDGSDISFSHLCIATGARPRTLNIEGIEAEGVYQLRDADDAGYLRDGAGRHKRVVVVGGGFIGLEAAATLHGLGLEVSVVEAAPRLMGRAVAAEISQFVLERFRKLGIKVYLDTPISHIITAQGKVTGVICGEQGFDVDMVLIGIGVVPNQELAQAAGLDCGNGIFVDEKFETSAKNIYAIGDVCTYKHWQVGERIRLESVQNATDQAKNLAAQFTGRAQPYRAVAWFWSEQADMKLQMVGLNHHSHTRVSRENPGRGAFTTFHFDEAKCLIAIDTINAPADHMVGRKLIAAGISPTFKEAADPEFALKSLL